MELWFNTAGQAVSPRARLTHGRLWVAGRVLLERTHTKKDYLATVYARLEDLQSQNTALKDRIIKHEVRVRVRVRASVRARCSRTASSNAR